MKTKIFSLIGVLILVAAFTSQQLKEERGAISCYDVFYKQNIPALYDVSDFKQCYARSWWHPFNIKRVDEMKQAIKFWTPERVTYARMIKNRGGSYGGASSAGQLDELTAVSIDPVNVEPSDPDGAQIQQII